MICTWPRHRVGISRAPKYAPLTSCSHSPSRTASGRSKLPDDFDLVVEATRGNARRHRGPSPAVRTSHVGHQRSHIETAIRRQTSSGKALHLVQGQILHERSPDRRVGQKGIGQIRGNERAAGCRRSRSRPPEATALPLPARYGRPGSSQRGFLPPAPTAGRVPPPRPHTRQVIGAGRVGCRVRVSMTGQIDRDHPVRRAERAAELLRKRFAGRGITVHQQEGNPCTATFPVGNGLCLYLHRLDFHSFLT